MKLIIFLILLFSFALNSQANSQQKDRISGPFPDDDFMALLNPLGPSYNIAHLDQMNLTKGQAAFEPWASSYWPIHRGILAYRYPDKTAYNSKAFIDNYKAFHSIPSENYIVENKIAFQPPIYCGQI